MTAPIDLDAYEDEYDDAEERRGRSAPSQSAIERLEAIGQPGVVVTTHRGEIEVLLDGDIVPAVYGGSMRGERVVVGDRVRVEPPAGTGEHARLLARDERSSWLARADDDGGQARLLAANLDRVLVVVAADHLSSGLGLVERVLVAGSIGAVPVGLVVNKMDLVEADHVRGELALVEGLVAPVVLTSGVEGTGVDELRAAVAAGWTALVGHSGVGKSTLFNLLVPDVQRRVAELGPRGGRHTTVRAMAHRVGAGWLVDTPGIRSFGITGVTADELAAHWPGLDGLGCRAPACTHTGEEGCRADERVSGPRLERYRMVCAALRSSAGH